MSELKLGDHIKMWDGTEGRIISLYSKEYQEWDGTSGDFMFITKSGQIRVGKISEIIGQ